MPDNQACGDHTSRNRHCINDLLNNPVYSNGSGWSVRQKWSAGCRAAAERLAAPDRRRKTERNYRAGWNNPVSTTAAAPAPRVPERISPGTSFRPGQTIVQEIVPDREARGAPAPAGDAWKVPQP